ncbi:hypothetical protein OAS95_02010 [Pelagibacteraceae bacterium]|nr:hypothetical protein [Pelagibacteraceae bacterium]
MEQIYDTNEKLREFNFDKLVLAKPTLISGGNYFIRFKKDNIPLYIQPPACNTRNGFVKNGRKYYTDMLFTNEDEYIIQWFEKLEEYCIQYIYEHRDTWFDGNMEKADIENYFTSPLKVYKSGKFYLIRTNIPTALDKPSIKIYDEDENQVDFSTITENTKLMNIIEVQGIKCSARSFQIELEMKQSLLLRPEEFKLFDKCVIQTKPQIHSQTTTAQTEELVKQSITKPIMISTDDNNTNEIVSDLINDISSEIEQSEIEQSEILPESDNNTNNLGKSSQPNSIDTDTINTNIDINTVSDEPDSSIDNNTNIKISNDSMEEVVFTLEDLPTDEKLTLKKPNEVYYQMYRDARQKAKVAKELALSSYLEAKNIKNTYMLNEIDSDTSDLEIDDESINSEND